MAEFTLPPLETATPQVVQNVFSQAIEAHKGGDFLNAERGYKYVLSTGVAPFEVKYLLGAVLVQREQFSEAVEPLSAYVAQNPNHSAALNALGAALSKTGQHEEALEKLSMALNAKPNDVSTLVNLGRAAIDAKKYEEGRVAYTSALKEVPNHPLAIIGQAHCLSSLGAPEQAALVLADCIDEGAGNQETYGHLISLLLKQEQFEKAHLYAAQGLSLWPSDDSLLLANATASRHIDPIDQARPFYEELLKRNPDNPSYLNKFSGYLYDLGLWKEAEFYAQRAIKIDPTSIGAINNLGRIRQQRGDLNGARRLYEEAIRIRPDHADGYNNLGNLLLYLDEVDEAISRHNKAHELAPKSKDFLFNRSIAVLTNGVIRKQVPDHRARFDKANPTKFTAWPWPSWSGEDLDNKRILMWGEQGIGDEVIHARCAGRIAGLAESSVLMCADRLTKLFARSFPGVDVCPRQDSPGPEFLGSHFDYQASTIDVNCWSFETNKDILGQPYLKADPEMTHTLRDRYLEENGGRPLIGISWWSGNTNQSHFKSTPLNTWKEILSVPDVAFVNLQYGNWRKHLDVLKKEYGVHIYQDANIDPMGDLDIYAAQVAAMDHVITISNAAAHMAGALGVPVWNMTPTGPGRLWYWFTEGSGCPWYESMELFRHKHDEGWKNVLKTIETRLKALAPTLGTPEHLP